MEGCSQCHTSINVYVIYRHTPIKILSLSELEEDNASQTGDSPLLTPACALPQLKDAFIICYYLEPRQGNLSSIVTLASPLH